MGVTLSESVPAGRSLWPLHALAGGRAWSRRRARVALLLGAVFALVADAVPLLAQQAGEAHFTVETPESALVLEREYRPPKNALITHVRLNLDEPTWLPDVPGFPQLPFVTRVVAIPLKSSVESTTVTVGKSVTISGIGLVGWGQLPWLGRPPIFPLGTDGSASFVFHGAPDEVPPDDAIAQGTVWPKQSVELAETRTVASYELLTYRIYPAQWYPNEDALHLLTSITVNINYVPVEVPPVQGYADAMRIREIRDLVTNPWGVVEADPYAFSPGGDTRYLIITDNYRWGSNITRGAGVGDMVGELKHLADWKSRKGVPASVATITDIVNGSYGDFTPGARDLQEVIRNFIKFASQEWSTYWVLLGGNAHIIPPREAVGNVVINGHYLRGGGTLPDRFFHSFDAASSTVRIHAGEVDREGYIGPDTLIVALNSGRAFARTGGVPSATSPGWRYTDSSYADETVTAPGEYIFLRGPLADIQSTDFYSVQYTNLIPTDLYYSALAPDPAGRHDWDGNDNQLYGQYNYGTAGEVDGASFTGTVALGRAPVANATEAHAFVAKVLAYEQYAGGIPAELGEKLLLGADDWFSGPAVVRSFDFPPPAERYFSLDGGTSAVLHFAGRPTGRVSQLRLIAWNDDGSWWEVPFNPAPSSTDLGYYFCTSDTYSEAATISFPYFGLFYSMMSPTAYVRVEGPADHVRPTSYFFDQLEPDGAVIEKEQVRALLAGRAPGLTRVQRLYKDLLDAPGYPAPDLGMLAQPLMRDALNTGYNIVSLSGHGWWGGCCGVDHVWVPALTNGFAGGIVYADSCLTNEFNKPKGGAGDVDAVSELFLKNPGGGAAAYVGNSRFSLIGCGAGFERLFWQRLATSRRVGILHKSKELNTASNEARWVNYALNLMGDPEMPLWLERPVLPAVHQPATIGAGSSLHVWVGAREGVSLPGAVVCLTGPHGIYAISATNVYGSADFSLAEARAGDTLGVTVTADGYIPYQGTVVVEALRRVHRRLPRH